MMCLYDDDQLSLAYDMYRRLLHRTDYITNVNRDNIYNNNNVKSNLVIVNGGHQSLKPHRHRQQKIPHRQCNNKHITYLDDDQIEE